MNYHRARSMSLLVKNNSFLAPGAGVRATPSVEAQQERKLFGAIAEQHSDDGEGLFGSLQGSTDTPVPSCVATVDQLLATTPTRERAASIAREILVSILFRNSESSLR
jgi:hypothetical protein